MWEHCICCHESRDIIKLDCSGHYLAFGKKRHRGDSNPCGRSPMDFESISLAARTQCHDWVSRSLYMLNNCYVSGNRMRICFPIVLSTGCRWCNIRRVAKRTHRACSRSTVMSMALACGPCGVLRVLSLVYYFTRNAYIAQL